MSTTTTRGGRARSRRPRRSTPAASSRCCLRCWCWPAWVVWPWGSRRRSGRSSPSLRADACSSPPSSSWALRWWLCSEPGTRGPVASHAQSTPKATYLDAIVAAHRAAAATDARAIEAASPSRPRPAAGPRLPIRAARGRRRAGGDRRGEAAVAVEGRPGPRPRPARSLAGPTPPAAPPACRCSPTPSSSAGRADDLAAARAAVAAARCCARTSPSSADDVCDARLMGADCRAADRRRARRRRAAPTSRAGRRARPRRAGRGARRGRARAGAGASAADLVGVNQRDLVTFEVDSDRAVRVAAAMPAGVVRVAESGVARPPTTPRRWPRPATTPCWWASRWSPRATRPRPSPACGPCVPTVPRCG